MKIISVTGVGNSGKSAAVDLLREFKNIHCFHYSFEFDFLRISDGLLDLHHHLCEDWSPIRSHEAIRRFNRLITRMGTDPHWYELGGLIRSSSQRYDSKFKGEFCRLSREFVSSFVLGSYRAEWPYDWVHANDFLRFFAKMCRRTGFRRYLWREVLLADGTRFREKANSYIQKLLCLAVPNPTESIVLNNSIEPFSPLRSLDLIEGSKLITVVRDPRDIFVSGQNLYKTGNTDKKLLASDNDGANKSFLGGDDVSVFVERYRLQRAKLYNGSDSRTLVLRFEDLAFQYAETLQKVKNFLELSDEDHVSIKTYFRPEVSQKNIGLWKQYSNDSEIEYISRNLNQWLVNDFK